MDALDLIQKVLGILAILIGGVYLTGGLIVNLHLSRFGVSEYQLLKAKYLAVGLNFLASLTMLVLSVSFVCAFLSPVHSLSSLQIRLVISTIALLWTALLYYSQGFRNWSKRFGVCIFRRAKQEAISFCLWILSVIGIALYPMSVAFSYGWMVSDLDILQQSSLYLGIAVLYGVSGLMLATLYFGVEIYANPVPTGPQAADFIGTGKPQIVQFVGDKDVFKLLKQLGIPLETSRLTAELGLLDETGDYYLVVVPDGNSRKAFKIRRDGIKGIAFTRS